MQTSRSLSRIRRTSAAGCALVVLTLACGDGARVVAVEPPVALPSSADPSPVDPATQPLYAIPTEVYGADFATSTSFVSVVPSLDVERIGLDQAREKDGRASVMAIDNYLYVASSSAPVIERFAVQPDGSLVEAGRLSFANYGLPEFFSIDAWGNIPISPTKAYVFNGSTGAHVVWNPETLEIVGEIPGPEVLRPGWDLESVAIVRGIACSAFSRTWTTMPGASTLARSSWRSTTSRPTSSWK